MTLLQAIDAKAAELFGPSPRLPCAICYTLWIVQARNLAKIDERTFMTYIAECSRARQGDPEFDEAMRTLVTFAINWRG